MSCLPLTQAVLDTPLISMETRKADKIGYLVIKDCQYEILLGETKIGRNASQCTIILESETISQVHAVIESEGPEDSFLYDNNSTNKTKIGKMVLKPYYRYKISNNDLITLGSIISKFIVISHSNCNSPTPVLSSKISELGIKNTEDNTINKLLLKENDFNSQETTKETTTEIFKISSTFDFSKSPKCQKKSVNESPGLDIFNQSTQCELVNSEKQIKQFWYYSNCSDISDEIFNATTQCEFPVDSEIFNLPTQCVIQKSTQTSKTEVLKKTIFDSDSSVSHTSDHESKNKVQKFSSNYKNVLNDGDILDCNTQFEIKVKDNTSHKISNIMPNSSQILRKKLQFAEELNDIEQVQEEILESEENKSVYEKKELKKANDKLNFFNDNEDKEFFKLMQMNSQNIVVTDDRQIHFGQQKIKSKYYTKLLHDSIPNEIFDLPTQINGQDDGQKNFILCAEKIDTDFMVLKNKSVDKCNPSFDTSIAVNFQVTENEKMSMNMELVNLKEDNSINGGKEDTFFLEKEKSSDQKKIDEEFVAAKSDEDDMTQIQSHCKNEFFREAQKLYAVQTMMDSNLINGNQCLKVNANDFENDKSGIEQHNCIKNELKPIDDWAMSDETESDLEIKKIALESSLKKETSPYQKHFINSGNDKSNSSSLLPKNEDLQSRRSLSESSDRTVSDLDVTEMQNNVNLNIKIGKNIKDKDDFVSTYIFSSDNDLRNFTEKAQSDGDCCLNSNLHIMEQMKSDICEKSIAIQPYLQQSLLKLNKSVFVNSDNDIYSDAGKFDKIIDEMKEYKKSEISIEKDIKKDDDDNSNESESLIKIIEDSNILYENILISQNEENIYHFNKLPIKVETNADGLAKSDSSPTLLSSHPVFDAFSEINDILAKKSSRESSTDGDAKMNENLQVFINEVPTHELLLVAEKSKALTSKTHISDSDETDCEVAESYFKDKRWKDEDERARNASPLSKIEQISFHELVYDDDEIEFGQPTLQLASTPEFKYESEQSSLSDSENYKNCQEELGESDSKKIVENRIKSSRNLFHTSEIKKPSCDSTSYFTICKPDGIKINESPLKRAQQMNLFDATPKKKSKNYERNVETGEVKTGAKKVRRRKNWDSASCAHELNLKIKNGIMSCKKENSKKTSSKQNNSAETSSIQMKTVKKGKNECRFIAEIDLGNIIRPEGDGFEISSKEKEEVKEEVKRNLKQRQGNVDYFSSGSGKRRRMRPELSTEEMESKSSFTKIVFTGIESAAYIEIITQLDGKVINDLKEGQVLVTDRARRTVKFLCAVARGIPIVSPKWLVASEKKLRLIDPWSFLLKDRKAEKLWDFNLKSSLDKARKHKLLHGYSVFATESTKPPVPEILDIVACCGGIPLISFPDIWPEKSIVLTCNEDRKSWPSRKHRHVKIVHYEIILGGVLKQLIDFKTYKLR